MSRMENEDGMMGRMWELLQSLSSGTMRVVGQQGSNLFGRIGDAGRVLSTNSVEILLSGLQSRHLQKKHGVGQQRCSGVVDSRTVGR